MPTPPPPDPDVLAFIRHLYPDLRPDFPLHDLGTAPAGLTVLRFLCGCRSPKVRPDADVSDPFKGRTPTAAQLEDLFAGDMKTQYRPVERHVWPETELRLARGTVAGRPIELWCGQCQDCGTILYAEAKEQK